jgi:hypothetical protein
MGNKLKASVLLLSTIFGSNIYAGYLCQNSDGARLTINSARVDQIIVEMNQTKEMFYALPEVESSPLYTTINYDLNNGSTLKLVKSTFTTPTRGGCGRAGCFESTFTRINAELNLNNITTNFICSEIH